jgi:hypothetical protein
MFAFYKATIMPMVRWSSERAGFPLDLKNIRNPVQIVPSRVLDRIGVPDFEIDDSFIYPDHMRKEAEAKDAARKRTPTPKPSEFAISLAAYIQTVIGRVLCVVKNRKSKSATKRKVILTQRIPFMSLLDSLLRHFRSLIRKFMGDRFPLNDKFRTGLCLNNL